MSQLKKGVLLSYLNIVLRNTIGILLTPFIVAQLGDSEYGLYMLIGSFIAYFALMDLGINKTTTRFIAKYRVDNNNKEKQFISTISIIYIVISLIIIILGIITYSNFEFIFEKSLTPQQLDDAKLMFVILIFSIAITIPGGIFIAISIGYEKFIFTQTLSVIKYLTRSLLLVILLWQGGKALTIVLLDTAINIIFIMTAAYYVIFKIKVKVNLSNFNKTILSDVFSYSIWIFIFAIFNNFQWRSGQVVLGILKNTETVAVFAIGIMLGTYYGAFSSAISNLLLPKATKMLYDGTPQTEINNMFIKIGNLILLLLFFILGGFILVGQDFISLWVGENYDKSWTIALLVMIVITIPLSQSFASNILEASKKLKFKVLTAIISMTLGLLLGIFLINYYDVFGMIIGLLTGRIVYEIILNFYYIKVIKLDIVTFFKKVYLKKTVSFIITLILAYSITTFFKQNSWSFFIIKSTIYAIIYFTIFFLFAMTKYEKKLLLSVLKKK